MAGNVLQETGVTERLDRTPLEVLGLSTRAYNCLRRAGLRTVAEVAALSDQQLLGIRNLGTLTLAEIREKLADYLGSLPLRGRQEPSTLPPEPQLIDGTGSNASSPSTLAPSLLSHQARSLDDVPIEALGVSVRPLNALLRSGITTVGHLARLSRKHIRDIRNIGEKSLSEIEEKLKAYLATHPLPLHPSTPAQSKSPDRLLDPDLLTRVAQAPLDSISIERLALPPRSYAWVRCQSINSVGGLVERYDDIVAQDPSLGERLERYLTWLAEQDEAAWLDEVAGRGISPLYRLTLAETTLDEIVERWLGSLRDRERQILEWRFGLNGQPLTLEEIGRRLNVTRERVRQIQGRALGRLAEAEGQQDQQPLHALTVHLLHAFVVAGGLMTEAEVGRAITEAVSANDVNVQWVARLWLATHEEVQFLRRENVWGLATAPLHLVPNINRQMVRLLERTLVPLTAEELLTVFRRTQFYQKHRSHLPDGFVHACLRTNLAIEVTHGVCRLRKWTRRRTPAIIQALREIGEPVHYTVISERVNALLPSEMRTTPDNVHAELGRRTDLFVRVGRGVFALKEWGLPDDGSVANAAYRVLSEEGRPLHIEAIAERVLETWRVERSSVYAAVSNDDRFYRVAPGTFGLVEWEIERLNETEPVLNICPPPLPDRRGERNTFFESVLVARDVLRARPTVAGFLRQMLKWAGTGLEKSNRYLQNVLNAYYVVGLIPYTVYRRAAGKPLYSTLLDTDDLRTLRLFCLRCMMKRLARMPEFIALLAARQPCTARELASEFHTDAYTVRTARDEVLSRLRILRSLGAAALVAGGRYRLTRLGKREVARRQAVSSMDKTVTEDPSSPEIDWLDASL